MRACNTFSFDSEFDTHVRHEYIKKECKLIENISNYANKLDLCRGCEWAKCML